MRLRTHIAALILATCYLGSTTAEAKVFTGKFEGQGTPCWGDLYIRTKTIEWNTYNSLCYSTYTIVKKTFADRPKNFDYILYKLDNPDKKCRWRYIGMYFYVFSPYLPLADDWSVAGFPAYKDYENFDEQDRLTGNYSSDLPFDPVLLCDLPNYYP
jgi:hypothetical protein